MTSPRVCDIQAIVDIEDRELLALKVAGSNSNESISLAGLSAVTTVAGVSPDVGKDIPAASLATALGVISSVAGITGDPVISQAELRAALGLPFTVAGVAANAWLGDVAAASILQALQATQDITWANLATTPGTYAGQRKRLPSLDGLGGYVYVIWNATKNAGAGGWEPDGVQTLSSLKRIAGASGTTSSVTIPSITLPGGPFWKETMVEIALELTSTVNGCTAAPVQMSLGAMTLINDTTQPSRAKRFSRPVRIQDTAVQFCHARGDNQYNSFTNLTAGALQGTVNTAADMTLSAGVDTGWVNASAHVLSMEMYEILWRR